MKVAAKIAVAVVVGLPILLLHVWAMAALSIDAPALVGTFAVVAYVITLIALAVALGRGSILVAASLVPILTVTVWWLGLEPSNDREWLADVGELARAEIDGDRITIRNLRNFDYRTETDFTERWETRTYDLSKLRGVDLFLSTWGSPHIAHTIVSWDFGDGDHLAISIETRKEESEEYSAILGFFRQFELYYVVADERDVVRLRTNYRGESVRLYRLKTDVDAARAILLDYLRVINELGERPKWYNALTHNCTTTIRQHSRHVGEGGKFDYRLLINGTIDELGYERGNVDTSMSFEELRRRSNIDDRAKAADIDSDFSVRIREGLPGAR